MITIHELIERMESCEQAPGVSTLDHGVHVLINMRALIEGYPAGPVPDWYLEHRAEIVESLPPAHVWGTYAIYHDCGKWAVREVDDQGRQHFPDHARASYNIWQEVSLSLPISKLSDNRAVWDLMLDDMVLHTQSSEVVGMMLRSGRWSTQQAATLLLSSLAELHTNAPMFGGFESTSYKIKAKHVKRRGAQVCAAMFGGGS